MGYVGYKVGHIQNLSGCDKWDHLMGHIENLSDLIEQTVTWLVVQCAHLEKYDEFVNGVGMTSHI